MSVISSVNLWSQKKWAQIVVALRAYRTPKLMGLNVTERSQHQLGKLEGLFSVRFKELFLSYKNQNQNSRSAQQPPHPKKKNYSIRPLEDIVKVLQVVNICMLMNVLEKFYIYSESQMSNQINDTSTSGRNTVFETVVPQSGPRQSADSTHLLTTNLR